MVLLKVPNLVTYSDCPLTCCTTYLLVHVRGHFVSAPERLSIDKSPTQSEAEPQVHGFLMSVELQKCVHHSLIKEIIEYLVPSFFITVISWVCATLKF